MQPSLERLYAARREVGGRAFAVLVALVPPDPEQPRVGIERLDDILGCDGDQLARAQAGIVGDREQRAIAQPGGCIIAGPEDRADMDAARCGLHRIFDRAAKSQRPRLLLP